MLFALAMGALSAMEVVIFDYSRRADLLGKAIPADVFRWGRFVASVPVLVFLLSLPIAFMNTTPALSRGSSSSRWKCS